MNDEELAKAIAAYRETTREEPGERGLDRLQRSLQPPSSRTAPRHLGRFVWPLAAALAVGSAWAAGNVPRWFGSEGTDEEPTPAGPQARAGSGSPRAVVSVMTPPVRAQPDELEQEPVPTPRLPPKPTARTTAPAPSLELAPPLDLDALYRTAHDAQFKAQDPGAALVAWNRYLAAADPSARLLLEARYNRALALHSLGRREEAKAALLPFAEGDYGSYRRNDARQLIARMEEAAP